MEELTLDQAILKAIELNDSIQKNNLELGYEKLSEAINDFENLGYPIESIIPEGESELGFSLSEINSKDFFKAYSKLIRNNLCKEDGELSKLVSSGIASSTGAVLTAIVTTLGIPAVALSVMIPIAVIIVNTGVEAFCEITSDEKE